MNLITNTKTVKLLIDITLCFLNYPDLFLKKPLKK